MKDVIWLQYFRWHFLNLWFSPPCFQTFLQWTEIQYLFQNDPTLDTQAFIDHLYQWSVCNKCAWIQNLPKIIFLFAFFLNIGAGQCNDSYNIDIVKNYATIPLSEILQMLCLFLNFWDLRFCTESFIIVKTFLLPFQS